MHVSAPMWVKMTWGWRWRGNKGRRMCESAVLSGMRNGYGEYTGKWSAAHCIQLGGLEGNSHQTLFWDICHVFDGFICSKTAPYPRPRCLSIAPVTAPLLSGQTKFAVGQTTRLENTTTPRPRRIAPFAFQVRTSLNAPENLYLHRPRTLAKAFDV